MPNKADVDFGNVSLCFDHASAYQSLRELGEGVVDIWIDPIISEEEMQNLNVIKYLKDNNLAVSDERSKNIETLCDSGIGKDLFREIVWNQNRYSPWDIIYSSREDISIDDPVFVRDDETAEKYAVHKKYDFEKNGKPELRIVND